MLTCYRLISYRLPIVNVEPTNLPFRSSVRFSSIQMVRGVGKGEFQPVCFGHQYTDIRICPILRRHVLQQDHETLEVSFQHQPLPPVEEESCTDVQLEGRKPVRFGEVRVPKADGARQRYLSSQQVVHPTEGELEIVHAVVLQVLVQWQVDAAYQLFQLIDLEE